LLIVFYIDGDGDETTYRGIPKQSLNK